MSHILSYFWSIPQVLLTHASSWKAFVRDYKGLLTRIQKRHGIKKPKMPFNIKEVNNFLDQREGMSTFINLIKWKTTVEWSFITITSSPLHPNFHIGSKERWGSLLFHWGLDLAPIQDRALLKDRPLLKYWFYTITNTLIITYTPPPWSSFKSGSYLSTIEPV